MKIISKFQDYYDCGLAFGQNKDLVYVRHTTKKDKELVAGQWPDYINHPYMHEISGLRNKKIDRVTVETSYISFCGKVYPIGKLELTKTYNKYDPFSVRTEHKTIYTKSDFSRELKNFFSEKQINEFIVDSENLDRSVWRQSDYTNLMNFLTEKESSNVLQKLTNSIHYKNSCPIFLIGKKKNDIVITLNPVLKDINFYKIEDAYSAFTEVEMFMGGVLAQKENEIVKISDEHLAQAKGFDCYSFKKEPSKKKRKACKCPK